jgi:hypothetical protein
MKPLMMTSHATRPSGLWRFWPFGAGGLLGPVLAAALTRWMRLDVASGIGMFVSFTIAVFLFERRSRQMPRALGPSLMASVLSGIAAGLVTGGVASLLQSQ